MSEDENADRHHACAVGEAAEGDDVIEEDADHVDKFGIPVIPVTIKHSLQNLFTPVWQYIHRLVVPHTSSQRANWPYTHICTVCSSDLKVKDATATAWLICLMRQKSSSNAQLHMLRQHKSHPYSIEAAKEATATKRSKLKAHDAETPPLDPQCPQAKEATDLSGSFSRQGRRDTNQGNAMAVIVGPAAHNLSEFRASSPNETFIKPVEHHIPFAGDVLWDELLKARAFQFVAMMHDMFTNGSNVNVIGVTIQFVNSEWRLVQLSLLATPNSTGHAAPVVANLIKEKIQARYDLNFETLARFTVSDTTGSARNVADHFESSDQVDCLMHLLSLCLLYALGLKENTRQGGTIIVTPGGRFSDGNRVMKQLRNLATFFRSPGRLTALNQFKDLYNLPRVNIASDAKTRVVYAATLLRRAIYNFFAFSKYFERASSNEQSTWLDISADDWTLSVEMEAITHQMAQFSIGEIQKKGVSSSYVLLFRMLIKMTLDMKSFPCLVLERPDVLSTEFTHRRVSKDVTHFSDGGKRCLLQLREQWTLRFPQADDNKIKAMLLDSRIKPKASLVVGDAGVLARVEIELEKEHEMIFLTIEQNGERDDSTAEHLGASDYQWFNAEQAADSELRSLLAAEALSARNTGNSESRSRAAANALKAWKELSVTWPCQENHGSYNVLHLYNNIDILQWFRDNGEKMYPSVALLARIYLGKPISTAAQERFFSVAGYVVNDLRTCLNDNRAELLCMMKANWQEYKLLFERQHTKV